MVLASKANADELKLEVTRAERLIKSNTVSRQLYDQTIISYRAAQAKLEATKADVVKFKAQRGQNGNDNLLLRQAKNSLQNAQLLLNYADVRADVSGQITNLQLQPGKYAQVGSPVAAIVVENQI